MTVTESGTVRTRDRQVRTFRKAGLTQPQNISICATPTVSRRDGGVVTQRTANPLPSSADPSKYAVLPVRSRHGFVPSRGTGCALLRTGYLPDSRRSNSRSTASRTNAARPYIPTKASIRARASGDSRTGTRVKCSGGRPIGRAVTGMIASGKKTAPFSVASINSAVYINGTL